MPSVEAREANKVTMEARRLTSIEKRGECKENWGAQVHICLIGRPGSRDKGRPGSSMWFDSFDLTGPEFLQLEIRRRSYHFKFLLVAIYNFFGIKRSLSFLTKKS